MKNVPENNNIIVALNSESQLYQPVRLYYRIYDIEQVRSYLEEIKSIIYHPVSNEWLWLQSENTTYTPCEDIDKKVEDNNDLKVRGVIQLYGRAHISISVSSHEYASDALTFFDKYIPQSAMMAEHIDIINRLFLPSDIAKNSLSKILDNPQSITSDYRHTNSDFPLIEVLPIHYSKDGPESLNAQLSMRQRVAVEHHRGNTDFRVEDIYKGLFS